MSVTENQEQLALSLYNQASIYVQQGKTEDAIGAYKEVISLKPDWAEAYRNLAKVLGNIGELKESANYWYQAFNLDPTWPTAADYLALGNMLVQVQQLEDAETCYRHSIALNPNAVEPYHNLGEVFTYQRKFDEAIYFYHQGLKINPDYSSCYLGLGKAFAQKSEWENAIAAFRKSISLTPDAPQVYHHLGNILDKIGKQEEALSCYQKALEINPELWDIYQRLGEFFAQQLKLEEAVDAYRKAIEINPQAYLSHHQLGQTLFKMKRWEDAVTCARRAIEIYPNTPWCYTQLGNNLIELGKEEDAIVCHRKAAALRGWTQCEERGYEFTRDWFSHNIPIWQKYLEHLANINGLNIVEIGSFQGMSTCWLLDNILTAPDAKITCIEPGFQPQFDPNIHKTGAADKVIKLAAFSQDVLGDLETEAFDLAYIDGCHLAESVLQDAILSWRVVKVGGLIIFDDYEWYDPESLLMITKIGVDIFLEIFKNRVEILHQGYQLIIKKIAHEVPNNALEVDQNQLISAQAYQALADALKQQGDVDGAIEHYRKAVELGNTQVENYENLGKLLQDKGNFEDAIIAYQKVLELKPHAGDIAYNLGEMSFSLKRWEDVVNYYRLALTLNGNFTEIYPNLGNALFNLKRWEEAIISYRHGIDNQQDFFWVYHHIGEAFLNLEKWKDAGEAFSHAIEKNPENSWSYCGLGTAFLKQENWQDAVTAYQKANQLNPNSFDSYFSLGDALMKLEKWDDAVIAYQCAVELNPDLSWCYQSLGDAFSKQQKWEDASRAYQSAIALNPDFFGSYYNLGEALFNLEKWQDAFFAYHQVLELEPHQTLLSQLLVNLQAKFSQLGNILGELGEEKDAIACHQKAAQLRGWSFCETKDYHFTQNWFTDNIPVWEKYLEAFGGTPGLQVLEIGSFQGMSTCWFLDYIITEASAQITCIDLGFKKEFKPNIKKTGSPEKVISLEGKSEAILPTLKTNVYDIIYIDSCHLAPSVLQDAILSWPLVKVGGLIIFDDYDWSEAGSQIRTTRLGIDTFLELMQNNVEIIYKGYQVIIKKITDTTVPHININEMFSSQAYERLANNLVKEGNLELAIAHYKKAIEVENSSLETSENFGNIFRKNKRLTDVIEAYEKAIKLNPQSLEATSNLGQVFLALERWEDAAETYRNAIAINPNNSWAYYYLGDALSKLSQWEDAIIAYRQAIRLNPDFFGSYHQLGDALSKLGNYAEAKDAYRHAIALNSDLAWSYHNLGIALSKLEEWEDAVNAYSEAIKLEPEMKWFYENLGEALRKLERWDEAIIAYSRSLEIDPHPLWVYDVLIELLQKKGRIDDEIALYQKLIEIAPRNCSYYDELGQLLMQKEQWEDAMIPFIKILQIQPNYSLSIYDKMAKALEKLGLADDAYGCYLNRHLSDYVIQVYCHLTEDLLTTSQIHPSLTHIDIYPKNVLLLSPTKKNSASALSETETPTEESLLSDGSDGKRRWDLMKTAITPETFVVVIPEGRAWGDTVTSAIITADNKLVINVSTKGNAELIISSDKLAPPELINGTVAFLSVKWGGVGYFHWMLDLIARIHLLYQSGFTLDKIDKFVVNSYDKSYQKETLTLLGIPPEKIIDSSHCPHIKAETLVVPSLQWQGVYKICNWACDFLKESFLNEKVTPNKRIYISREAPYTRKISNNDEVFQYLETLGFEKVLLERMSVGEQALCLASAEVVVAPHGAGLTNLVFCDPGTKVIEIFSPLYMPPEYWLLSNVCGLEHFSCIGELLDKDASRYDVYQDIFVNIDQLQELLTMAGVING